MPDGLPTNHCDNDDIIGPSTNDSNIIDNGTNPFSPLAFSPSKDLNQTQDALIGGDHCQPYGPLIGGVAALAAAHQHQNPLTPLNGNHHHHQNHQNHHYPHDHQAFTFHAQTSELSDSDCHGRGGEEADGGGAVV